MQNSLGKENFNEACKLIEITNLKGGKSYAKESYARTTSGKAPDKFNAREDAGIMGVDWGKACKWGKVSSWCFEATLHSERNAKGVNFILMALGSNFGFYLSHSRKYRTWVTAQ